MMANQSKGTKMKDPIQKSRRNFLKTSVAGATGLMVGGVSVKKASASNGGAWVDGMQINPAINNLRVVCAYDQALSSADGGSNNTLVEQHLDKMAMALAQKPTAAEAWATILRKPANKAWSDVVVGIKAVGMKYTVTKLTKVLTALGVNVAQNAYYFDGFSCVYFLPDAPMQFSSEAGQGTSLNGQPRDKLHGIIAAPVPYPAGSTSSWPCVADVANGRMDIMITLQRAESHGDNFGGLSSACKTHYGTFLGASIGAPLHGGSGHDGTTGMFAIQKSQAILGGTPPRQQLVIMDYIHADSNFTPCKLLMGTFAPIVDYLTIMKIRKGTMGMNPTMTTVNRYYSDFGYTAADVANLDFVDALSYVPSGTDRQPPQQMSSRLQLSVSNPAFKAATVNYDIPFGDHKVVSVDIFDQRGRLVRELNTRWETGSMTIAWDGKAESGVRLPAGGYIAKVKSGSTSDAGTIMLMPR